MDVKVLIAEFVFYVLVVVTCRSIAFDGRGNESLRGIPFLLRLAGYRNRLGRESEDEISDTHPSGPTRTEVLTVVQAARDRQRTRYQGKFLCNAHLDSKAVREHCGMETGAEVLLQSAMNQLGLSARAYDKVLRIARTIADVDESDIIAQHHVAEAIQYRSLDRELLTA